MKIKIFIQCVKVFYKELCRAWQATKDFEKTLDIVEDKRRESGKLKKIKWKERTDTPEQWWQGLADGEGYNIYSKEGCYGFTLCTPSNERHGLFKTVAEAKFFAVYHLNNNKEKT